MPQGHVTGRVVTSVNPHGPTHGGVVSGVACCLLNMENLFGNYTLLGTRASLELFRQLKISKNPLEVVEIPRPCMSPCALQKSSKIAQQHHIFTFFSSNTPLMPWLHKVGNYILNLCTYMRKA